jgi:hypothetical protein
VQHISGELPGALQKREMADVRLQQQSGIGDLVRHEFGVCAFDRLVMVGIDHRHRERRAVRMTASDSKLRAGRPRSLFCRVSARSKSAARCARHARSCAGCYRSSTEHLDRGGEPDRPPVSASEYGAGDRPGFQDRRRLAAMSARSTAVSSVAHSSGSFTGNRCQSSPWRRSAKRPVGSL